MIVFQVGSYRVEVSAGGPVDMLPYTPTTPGEVSVSGPGVDVQTSDSLRLQCPGQICCTRKPLCA